MRVADRGYVPFCPTTTNLRQPGGRRGGGGRWTSVERFAHAVAVAVRLSGVGRAAGIRAGAHLREVTAGGHGTADGACGDERVGRTVIPNAVAVLGDVACPGRRPA